MALVKEEQAMDSYDQDVLNGLVINQNVPAIRRHSSGENFWKTTKKNRYAHRRLAALRMVQALHWHDLLWVKCRIYVGIICWHHMSVEVVLCYFF